jgi:catechol 2,3-dioxygenase-like lactoylglutathione lyase family enzyme
MAQRTRAVGINHIAIEVGDVEEAVELYAQIFHVELRGRAGRMAFIDLGDQFIAVAPGPSDPPDRNRHIGLVVENKEAALAAAREAGLELRGNTFLDPWGNQFQVVAYSEVQFTKAPEVLEGMGIALRKTDEALEELRAKGLAP